MKKVILLLVLVEMALIIVACSSTIPSPKSKPNGEGGPPVYVEANDVGVVAFFGELTARVLVDYEKKISEGKANQVKDFYVVSTPYKNFSKIYLPIKTNRMMLGVFTNGHLLRFDFKENLSVRDLTLKTPPQVLNEAEFTEALYVSMETRILTGQSVDFGDNTNMTNAATKLLALVAIYYGVSPQDQRRLSQRILMGVDGL